MKSAFTNSRRRFLQTSGGILACNFIPRTVWGANERIRVACIGLGGKGTSDVADVAREGAQIVALCDVDERQYRRRDKDGQEPYPGARFYKDFRLMLEKEANSIDAVSVSTPDNTHCHAAVWAMRLGKHVYCQKPLTHGIWEARLMAQVAQEKNLATQMGNQGHATEHLRRAVELIRAGLVGKVTEVHCWTDRPIWPQGMSEVPKPLPLPNELDWYLWLGPAADRPYGEGYAPFKWRGWWDFGTGALGDMGCHIMDMPYWALDLGYPTSVEADAEGNTALAGPVAATVTYHFPSGPYSLPLKFMWYEGQGDKRRLPHPDLYAGLGVTVEDVKKASCLVIGEKGRFLFNRSEPERWKTLPGDLLANLGDVPKTIPRVANEDVEWLDAIKGGPPALSNFGYAARLTEILHLGNLAIRLGKRIEWDPSAMEVLGTPEADPLIRRAYRKGWEL